MAGSVGRGGGWGIWFSAPVEINEAFRVLDHDNDEKVSPQELVSAIRALGHARG
ncbi:EF-hand domain-containing protein [Streptomyces sp. SBC-4]|nr:EF-hand domain-containing protein [Streptomyces sp. SBC-4]MDV5143136.1 EF-hand domain-containing protein [Streptomyces sp. SBC-4]